MEEEKNWLVRFQHPVEHNSVSLNAYEWYRLTGDRVSYSRTRIRARKNAAIIQQNELL